MAVFDPSGYAKAQSSGKDSWLRPGSSVGSNRGLLTEQADSSASSRLAAYADSRDRQFDLLQTVWGSGYLRPCGQLAVKALVGPMPLSRSSRLLDLAAGIGGAADYLMAAFGVPVTAYERDYDLVTYGNRADKRGAISLQHYDPETVELPVRRFDAVIAGHLTCRLFEKERLLREVHRTLKPAGSFGFIDLVLREGKSVRDLRSESPVFFPAMKAEPWRVAQYLDCLRNAGFVCNHVEDESVGFRSDIIEAWQDVTVRSRTGQYTRDDLMLLVQHAHEWLETIRLIEAGFLGVMRFQNTSR